MNFEYRDFVGVFSDVFPEGFCKHLITEFNRNKNLGAGSDRRESEGAHNHVKNDYQINANGKNINFEPFNENNATDMFFKGLQHCFDAYSNQYSALKDTNINCNNMKMQETSTGGGYHVWHSEQGNGDHANRGLVYMLYLNTLPTEANGETEFLYQQRRMNPVENTMVLWPAAFTHAHRGNPVYGNNKKYIVTGWFYHE
ncbi:2OG-Fe(II) oxygenase [Flavobacteriaceae bacterium]|nr:2OG-Fe(II) oxygenase [Flavobacteriaceae bacterium]